MRRLPPGPPQGRLQGGGLRLLPQGVGVQAGGGLRPRAEDGISARRRPCSRGVRVLPQGRRGPGRNARGEGRGRLPRGEEGVRQLPPRRAQGRARRPVRELPHGEVLPRGVLPAPEVPGVLPGQARHRRVRDRAIGRPAHRRRARRAGSSRASRRRARPATRTRTWASSARPARAATRSRPGRSRNSSTRGRTSRPSSPPNTGLSPARSATRRERRRSRTGPAPPSSSRASRRSARAATRTPTTGRSASSARAATRWRAGRPLRAPSTRTRSSRSRASTSRRRAPSATSNGVSRELRTGATTATGSAARTTSTRPASATSAATATGRSAWTAVNWNHLQATGFALGVAHTGLPCESCHKGKVFTGLTPAVLRRAIRRTTTTPAIPVHVGSRIPDDLRGLPPAERPELGGRTLHPHDLPPRRGPHDPALRRLPQEQRLSRARRATASAAT